jgi:hypothetical protein
VYRVIYHWLIWRNGTVLPFIMDLVVVNSREQKWYPLHQGNVTIIISFVTYHRYIIFNHTGHPLGLKQESSKHVTSIQSHQHINYYWRELTVEDPKIFITMKEGEELEWSASAFALNVLGESDIKLVHHFARLRGIPITRILKMTIKENMGTIFVTIEFPSKPPYLIDNRLDEDIIISQLNDSLP